jgi:hypothetical protein
MKKHFLSLIEPGKRKKTLVLLLFAFLFITVSLIIGTSDNLPMIVMLLSGLILFYFGLLHAWEKASHFAILTAIFIIILVTDFLWPFINEAIAMSVGLVCLAGILSGIIGIFSRVKKWQRLPYSASLVSLLALGLISTNLDNPLKELIAPTSEWIFIIGLQIFITILLLSVALINKREKWFTKTMLITVTLFLIFLSVWGFYTSSKHFGEAVNSEVFAILMFRIFGSIEIIIAALSLYACK